MERNQGELNPHLWLNKHKLLMGFSDGSTFSSVFFFVSVFSGICFLNLVHFPPTFNPYLCKRLVINSRLYPQTHILIRIDWAMWWTNSIDRMKCSQFCITKPTSLFRKIHHLFKVSKGLDKQSCLWVRACAASCLICNGWKYTCVV